MTSLLAGRLAGLDTDWCVAGRLALVDALVLTAIALLLNDDHRLLLAALRSTSLLTVTVVVIAT